MASQSNFDIAKLDDLSKEDLIKIEHDLEANVRVQGEKVAAAKIQLEKAKKDEEEAEARVKDTVAQLQAHGYIVKDDEVVASNGGETK
ncbi:hypothetical protein KCV07_g5489, partial [Aureobasidium melanogenum]